MGLFHHYSISNDEVFIFDDFLIMQKAENSIIAEKEVSELKAIIEYHFKNKKMAYISNRINIYSINPEAYEKSKEISNIVAIAIISDDKSILIKAKKEKKLHNRPFGVFENLTEAIKWVRTIIDEEK